MLRVRAGAVLVVLALLVVNGYRVGGWWSAVREVREVVAPPPVTALPAGGPAWGAYDPERRLAGAAGLAVEQVYLPWNGDARRLTEAVRAVRRAGRVPLVTLEPWPAVWAGLAREDLLADVVAGRYDDAIRASCAALGREAPQPVLVRWGHEMDLAVRVRRGGEADAVDRYPWATGDAPGFVAAYRHFVAGCRAAGAANVAYVWSPGGDAGLEAYWPGAADVDYVGATVLGVAEWDAAQGADRPATFRELFDPRYRRLEAYGKPVLLCELGAPGPPEARRAWLAAAAEAVGAYPLLRAVVYYDAVDPVAWGDLGRPDWRLPPGAFPPAAPPAGAAAAASPADPSAGAAAA